jgi:hypothetical protein
MQGITQLAVYVDTRPKGRSQRAKALLATLRILLMQATGTDFILDIGEGKQTIHISPKEPGVVFTYIGPASDTLPDWLLALKPLRVELRAYGDFNFPQEGLYPEGGAEVSWHRTGSGAFWDLTLTMPTVEAAVDLVRRIRTSKLQPSDRWVNHMPDAALPADYGGDYSGGGWDR